MAARLAWSAAHKTEATEGDSCLWKVADVNQPKEAHHMAELAQVRLLDDSCSLPLSRPPTPIYPASYQRHMLFLFKHYTSV